MRSVAGAQSGERKRGGTSNAVARMLAPKLGEDPGRQVVTDDRAGAAGVAGAPAEFGVFPREEIVKRGRVVREANIQPE